MGGGITVPLGDIIRLIDFLSCKQEEIKKKEREIEKFGKERELKFVIVDEKRVELSLLPNVRLRLVDRKRAVAEIYMLDTHLREVILIRAPLQAFFSNAFFDPP